MSKRVQFVCQSSTPSGRDAIPTGSGTGQVSHPRCTRGGEVKKAYAKPAFRILSKEEAVLRLSNYGLPQSSGNLLTGRKANFRFGGSHRTANNR